MGLGSACPPRKTELEPIHLLGNRSKSQVERMKRTLKDAPVKTYHDLTHHYLKEHLQAFLMAYNFAKRLNMPTCLTPYDYICQCCPKSQNALP
jgi:hypothetical protein